MENEILLQIKSSISDTRISSFLQGCNIQNKKNSLTLYMWMTSVADVSLNSYIYGIEGQMNEY